MFDSIRQCQIVSPSGCTSLHSHHPLLQLLFQSYRKLRTRPKEWNRGWARFDISWERVRKRIVRWVLPTLQARLEFSSWPSPAHSHRQLIKVHQGPRSPSHSASPRSPLTGDHCICPWSYCWMWSVYKDFLSLCHTPNTGGVRGIWRVRGLTLHFIGRKMIRNK